jgi:hypothetical protein
MKPVGTAVAVIDLDATSMERKLKALHDSLGAGTKVAASQFDNLADKINKSLGIVATTTTATTIKVEAAYQSLGITSDKVYRLYSE